MPDANPGGLPPPPPSRGRDREVWVGVFVLAGLATALALLFTLTDAALFRGRYLVTTLVPDAGGIRRGDPVQMRGVNIGRVQRFKISPEGVAIRLEIEGEYSIPVDSRVELKSAGLLGGMVADVQPGSSSESLRNGGRLPGSNASQLMSTATGVANSAHDLLERLQKALTEQTIANLKNTAANAERGSAELEKLLKDLQAVTSEQRGKLSELTDTLRKTAQSLDKTVSRPELDRAIARLDDLTAQMNKVAGSLDRSSASLESVLARVDHGEGTLGRLSKDEALYESLTQASRSLNQLLEDIRRNPKKYVKLSLF